MSILSRNHSDTLIIGGGLAGLFCALKLAPRPVTIITAAPLGDGASSAWAQGGIAAAVAEGDTPEAHARDTIAAGAGLVDEAVALAMVREAPERIRDSARLRRAVRQGPARPSRGRSGSRAFGAAHRACERRSGRARHHGGTGHGGAQDAEHPRSRRRHVAEDLIGDGSRVTGAQVRGPDGRLVAMPARAVVLATGGIGHLYAVTTNPDEARGQGLAIAARAGALIADPEFVQFHPTAIDIGRDPAPLATEAIRGEGATLVNRAGERFMLRIHPDAELAPRDIVARGVFAEIAAGRGAYLDAKAIPDFAQCFPGVTTSCRSAGIDPQRDLIPVAPAAHYHMGGVATDARGRTSLEGLWAAGEVACTGAHGANRLASNSLLEAVVFAGRIAEDIASLPGAIARIRAAHPTERHRGPPDRSHRERALRDLMSAHVGVIRDRMA